MFLPFLPLIVASTILTLLIGLKERSDPWLGVPIWIVLPTILVFGILRPIRIQPSYPQARAAPEKFQTPTFHPSQTLHFGKPGPIFGKSRDGDLEP